MEAVREMTRQELIDENNRLRSELNNVQAVDGLYQDMCSNIHALVTAIYGDGYYNTGMDAWTCNYLCCEDIAAKCGFTNKILKRFRLRAGEDEYGRPVGESK